MITCAKGMTSGYSPLGALLVDDRLMEPFLDGTATFLHGFTFGGHPVSTAVALANLDLFEKEDLIGGVAARSAAFRAVLDGLRDLPIVGDVRGDGFFYGIELVKDKDTRETFDDDESERLLRGFLSGRPVRRRPDLPGRRPGRPGDPAGPPAGLRAGALRPDRRDPAVRPERGLDPALMGVPGAWSVAQGGPAVEGRGWRPAARSAASPPGGGHRADAHRGRGRHP